MPGMGAAPGSPWLARLPGWGGGMAVAASEAVLTAP